jgi:hypothetical protein
MTGISHQLPIKEEWDVPPTEQGTSLLGALWDVPLALPGMRVGHLIWMSSWESVGCPIRFTGGKRTYKCSGTSHDVLLRTRYGTSHLTLGEGRVGRPTWMFSWESVGHPTKFTRWLTSVVGRPTWMFSRRVWDVPLGSLGMVWLMSRAGCPMVFSSG